MILIGIEINQTEIIEVLAEKQLEEMEKIREDVIMEFPFALLDCYKLARIVGEEGKAEVYKLRALALALALASGQVLQPEVWKVHQGECQGTRGGGENGRDGGQLGKFDFRALSDIVLELT